MARRNYKDIMHLAAKPSALFQMEEQPVKPLDEGYVTRGALMFGGMAILGTMAAGAAVGTYIFFGVVTLGGIIAIVESNPWLKRLATKGSLLIDIGLFGFTIYASAALGVTVAAAFTVAGLGWTLVYARYLRRNEMQQLINSIKDESNK